MAHTVDMNRRDCLALGGLGWPKWAASEPLRVVYPRFGLNPQSSYGYRLLELALKRSGRAFELSVHAEALSDERLLLALEQGVISVLDGGAAPEYEARFRAVYFPIDLGLSGLRRLVVRQADREALTSVHSLQALRRFRVGQGRGWSDAAVLRRAGLRVVTAETSSLFRMLEGGRFDLLPLAVTEAPGLLQEHAREAPSAVLAPEPLLHYPFARLFYVSPTNPSLQGALWEGLRAAYADGSLSALFATLPDAGPWIRGGGAATTVIRLLNPFLSERFRAMPARWFLEPGSAQGPAH